MLDCTDKYKVPSYLGWFEAILELYKEYGFGKELEEGIKLIIEDVERLKGGDGR